MPKGITVERWPLTGCDGADINLDGIRAGWLAQAKHGNHYEVLLRSALVAEGDRFHTAPDYPAAVAKAKAVLGAAVESWDAANGKGGKCDA